jgi:Rrf2 family protein
MVRLSKRVEYGLIALRHILTRTHGDLATAKEIARLYGIPYDLVAKVLQRLSKAGLITAVHGVRGGYAMAKRPEEIPVSLVINAIEGSSPTIVRCLADGPGSCVVFTSCTIKSPLTKVQANIERAFDSMTLSEIV